MVFLYLKFIKQSRCCELSLYPILYSFRRCPYAIRARYFLAVLEVNVCIREVVLKAKPEALLALGGRTSVPQLIDLEGRRYPESVDIIFWSLMQTKNKSLVDILWPTEKVRQSKSLAWVNYNDRIFKYWLDRYKYAERYPERTEEYYRQRGEVFLHRLERRLAVSTFILGDSYSFADICLFPFVRQFVGVNPSWFERSGYRYVRQWLAYFLSSDVFAVVMRKYDKWEEGRIPMYFPCEKREC